MSDADKKDPRIGMRLFSEIVPSLADGDLDREMSSEIAKVVLACEATGQKGKVVLTIEVKPGPKMMGLVTSIKTTAPRPALQPTHLFTDERGGLHTENPKQVKMAYGPRAVPGPTNDGEN
jgi:hypothetical protein